MTNPLAPGSLERQAALVTGSSRGIGADTVRYFAAGRRERRHQLPQQGAARREARGRAARPRASSALVVGADLTDAESVAGDVRRGASASSARSTSSC